MTPIVVCTVTGKCLPVLEASVRAYCPDIKLISHHVERTTSGQSYTWAVTEALKEYDSVIIANDDVVLNPESYRLLMEDVERLKTSHGDKLGFVAARSDCVRDTQNIKYLTNPEAFPLDLISPLFTWISKHAFDRVKFPPINWFGDDIACLDLIHAGFRNYVSRSYVHHAGSQTMGTDTRPLYLESIAWMEINRPDMVKFFKR